MKSFALKLAAVATFLLAGLSPLHGQTGQPVHTNPEDVVVEQKIIDRGLRSYAASLRLSDSEGIVESVIFQSAKTKLSMPEQDYSKIIAELQRLSFKGPNPALRYKAYVAAAVMASSEPILDEAQVAQALTFTEETRNEFFAFLAAALNSRQTD